MPKAVVKEVLENSIAEEIGICPGDAILSVDGETFCDILEYKFLVAEEEIDLEIEKADGTVVCFTVENNYEDLGIVFENELIDKPKSCHNKCIFCFIDQLPKGMRPTMYFKDDDTRLSFLQGNYVTLTNLDDDAINRIIRMRLSPINVSVHTTNPALRVKMLKNPKASKIMDRLNKFAQNNIIVNAQIVLCPDVNDGDELDSTIEDLAGLHPNLNSVSIVPVGLTRYREGLYPLRTFTSKECYKIIEQVGRWQNVFAKKFGKRIVYLSDEFYLCAKVPLPKSDYYDGYPQIENGVGLMTSMRDEFDEALSAIGKSKTNRHVAIATGTLAYDYIRTLADVMQSRFEGLVIDVYAIRNDFFGEEITVSGLVCGCDIVNQLKDKNLPANLYIPSSMLRADGIVFLDDMLLSRAEEELNVSITPVSNDGRDFVYKILGKDGCDFKKKMNSPYDTI